MYDKNTRVPAVDYTSSQRSHTRQEKKLKHRSNSQKDLRTSSLAYTQWMDYEGCDTKERERKKSAESQSRVGWLEEFHVGLLIKCDSRWIWDDVGVYFNYTSLPDAKQIRLRRSFTCLNFTNLLVHRVSDMEKEIRELKFNING